MFCHAERCVGQYRALRHARVAVMYGDHIVTTDSQTLCEILQDRAERQTGQLAYRFLSGDGTDEQTLTYGELDRQARAIAARIQAVARPGDRAILLYPQGLEFLAAFFGCLYAGVIAVPAYPPRANRDLPRLQAIVTDCDAVLALSTGAIAAAVQTDASDTPSLRTLHWLVTDELRRDAGEDRWARPVLDGEMVAFLQYTSGSTGHPKGVMISHRNLIHNSQCIRDRWGHSERSVGVSWLPQFHDLGLIIGILQAIYVGYPVTLMSPAAFIQRPYRWLEAISKYRGTTTCAPNFAFDLCVAKISPEQRRTLDLSCLEVVMNGAEPILVETLRGFAEAFAPCGFDIAAFRAGYGLAEGTVFVTTGVRAPDGPSVQVLSKAALEQHRVVPVAEPGPDAQRIVGCGPTAGDQELAIVHPDRLTRCPAGEIGEIWVRGDSVALGYWKRPEESAAVFQGTIHDRVDGRDVAHGPFLRTGDLGFVHGGELFITGRSKDLIIVRGRNHYPQDLERTVERVHPGLRRNCNASFSIRDDGEERAVVVQELRRDHAELDLDALIADIYRAVTEAHELALHAIVLIAEGDISKTSSGKIQRAACKQRYRDGAFKVIRQATFALSPRKPGQNAAGFVTRFHALDAAECRTQVESYLIQTLRMIRPAFFSVDVHHSLVRAGLDSLGVADLKTTVERDLGISLPYAEVMEISLHHLADEVIRQLTAGRDRAAATKQVDAMSDSEVNALLEQMLAGGGDHHG
jgi:acyl-CoA synthetase (AMP-forming)/AMP-acid ligase II